MKRKFSFLLLIILCLAFSPVRSQVKGIGLPSIINHQRTSYNASTQNWSVDQNSRGFMYFGNNDGVLEFDGTSWRVFPVPNLSVVRSVLALGDTIYTGAFEQIGFLAPDQKGNLAYHSLNHAIPPGYAHFDEIWNIFHHQNSIIFQSFNYIFIYSQGKIRVIEPLSNFSMMHKVNGRFYVVDNETGLMYLENDRLVHASSHGVFFRNEIRTIMPFGNDALLIGTSKEGLFIFRNNTLTAWNVQVNQSIKESGLFSARRLSNGNFAFGTISNGLYITTEEGYILQHLNRYKGLQNNTVLSIYEDRRNNLWLGLDNGIDFLEISSPITFINHTYNIETVYASLIHNNIMYIGTNQGLFAADFHQINQPGNTLEKFRLIKGTEGQVWVLEVIGNTLLCGNNYGCFQVDGYDARQISDVRGFWSFLKPDKYNNTIIAGTYTGLVRLELINGRWTFADEIEGFRESSRGMFIDSHRNLWVSHGYKGLYKLRLSEAYDAVTKVEFYKSLAGLPDELPYNIQVISDQMYITTQSGIFQYNHTTSMFTKPAAINRLLEGKGFIDKIHQDSKGNLWYFSTTHMGIIRKLEDGSTRDITSPFSSINESLLPAFENIYIPDPSNVFIGSKSGLIHYNPSVVREYNQVEEVFIREASFYGRDESTTIFPARSGMPQAITLPFSSNSVTFRFTLPSFENPDRIRFSYRLKGFDENWSAGEGINFKEYTNLREGNYTFEVKAYNAFDTETHVKSLSFTIEPPFFRSTTAYFIYSLLALMIIAGNFIFIRRRTLKIRKREKFRHDQRLARKEKVFREKSEMTEKELMHLRNESLRSEMKHKNKELANATLHLIQKNETLTTLKNDLSHLAKKSSSDKSDTHLVNNLLKKINRDLYNEKNWELFNNYFDEVHQDFIIRIKEKHPELSPKDLRLCAYLRMNISTKEIAPLMNISVRGVEISRYRLRKKMNLDRDANLTEYILNS